MVTRVKICGMTRVQDVEAAAALGAYAVGFVFEPSSSRYVGTRVDLEELVGAVPPMVEAVAVFASFHSNERLPARIGAVQAFDAPVGLPQKRILAFRQRDLTVEGVVAAAHGADAVLLDAYDPAAYGGTGKTVDLGFAAELRQALPIPMVLAGGLTPQNVAEAVKRVRPFAVDVSSGVELEPGVKDAEKMRSFLDAARNA